MKILDVELEDFDFNDADNLEKFEKSFLDTQKGLEKINTEGKAVSEVIRETCNLIFKCFDNIFGEGTAKKIFGDKTSLKICLKAFKDLKTERNKQDQDLEDMVSEIKSEYNPNRATRRAKK